jgi:hypothetical protein
MPACGDQLLAERDDLVGPRLERIHGGDARGDASERAVALSERGAVRRRKVGSRGKRPCQDTVEVAAPGRGAAFHNGEPIGREDERVHLPAQLLGRGELRAVEPDPLGAAPRERDVHSQADRPPTPTGGDTPLVGSRPNDLRVVPRTKRETLRREVDGLEQVGLAGAVRPGHEYEPRLQRELEPLVRAHVANRDDSEDHPARFRSGRGPRQACVADSRATVFAPASRRDESA